MKPFFYLSFLTLFLLPSVALAHIGGLPYFAINGIFATVYPVPSISVPGLVLPQDDGPEKYTVDKPIDFLFDINILQIPPDVLAKTTFTWDFGDGSPLGTGIKNIHTYTKAGSYLLSIKTTTADDPSSTQEVESVLLHVLPSPGYTLALGGFAINGQTQKDPINDNLLNFRPGTDLLFDASFSQSGSSPIATYQWNFGDGTPLAEGQKVHHTYATDKVVAAPVLRVTDSNGLVNDAYAQVEFRTDAPKSTPPPTSQQNSESSVAQKTRQNVPSSVWYVIGRDAAIGVASVAVLAFLLRRAIKGKRKAS